jgi:hypothetical protein
MDTLKNIDITQPQVQTNEIKIGTRSIESKKRELGTSKLSLVNPYYVYFPTFYKKEVKTSFVVFMM